MNTNNRITHFKQTLVIILSFLTVLSCSDNAETPENRIIAGDRSTVDYYFDISPQDLDVSSERVLNNITETQYFRQIDLNADGTEDLRFTYTIRTNDSGFKNYFLTISSTRGIYIYGEEEDVLGNPSVAPELIKAGDVASSEIETWPLLPLDTYLSFVESYDGRRAIDLNFFPQLESNAYLFFRLPTTSESSAVGWIHIEQTEDDQKPRLLDVGYKLVN